MLNSSDWAERVLAGSSEAAQRLRLQVNRVAPHFRTAVLVGEAGCLKEQVARALWVRSPLRDCCFEAHEGDALPDGVLPASQAKMLFVAGLGRLPAVQQSEAVEVLRRGSRTNRPELRVVFSSEVTLRGLVAAGRLSEALYDCVNAIEIRVPPMRERLDDLPALLDGVPLHPDALEAMRQHHWPGNLQELHEVIAGCVERAGGAVIGPEHLPEFAACAEDDLKLESVLRRHVTAVLEGCAGNKLRAAETLGISRSTLYRMLETNQA